MNKFYEKIKISLFKEGISESSAEYIANSLSLLHITDDFEDLSEKDSEAIDLIVKGIVSLISRYGLKNPQNKVPSSGNTDEAVDSEHLDEKECGIIEEIYNSDTIPDPALDAEKKSTAYLHLSKLPQWAKRTVSYIISFFILVVIFVSLLFFFSAAALCISLMVTLTAGGILLFFVGFIYGLTQLSVFTAAGVFEIGLGIVLGGLASLITILIFNLTTRVIPLAAKNCLKNLKKRLRFYKSFCDS